MKIGGDVQYGRKKQFNKTQISDLLQQLFMKARLEKFMIFNRHLYKEVMIHLKLREFFMGIRIWDRFSPTPLSDAVGRGSPVGGIWAMFSRGTSWSDP